ncbi:MAG: transglycosylase domain-containing protein [Deltaproteobacteria bacterium]|nr:transglycosylase domain-containing protein [Deltaproteobacteria bacterium]
MGLKRFFRAGVLLAAVAVLLLLRAGYLYYKVGNAMSGGAWEVPSILYGRPTRIHAGDPLGNLRLAERLRRLSYKKVAGTPRNAGTWSEEGDRIRIHIRNFRYGEQEEREFPVEIGVKDGRVATMSTASGAPLEEVVIEPEEVGRILGPGRESRRLVPLEAIPKRLQDAVLAAEDARFYSHAGIDAIGVARAFFANLRHMRFVQGGSTITQQLAKNFFLTPKKSLWRKIREAELALLMELRYSKKEIFTAYLNQIYLGQEGPQGIFGVEEATRFYFSKGVGGLSLEEAALLAGIIRSPNRYSPLRMPAAAKERRNWVLSRMAHLGTIREEEYRAAARSPVRTNVRRAPARGAEYFADYIQKVAEESMGDGKPYRAGYRIYTTLDPYHQAAAESAVARGLAEIEAGGGKAGEPLQAALVAVDPATGEMTAMVGGRGYGETQFNRAADARRQPGSAFKPFVLLAAMQQAAKEKGKVTLAASLSGEPVSIPTPEGTWTPANFEGKRYGTITVRRMIENSVNTAAVRLSEQVGLGEVVSAGRAAGIASPLSPVPTLARRGEGGDGFPGEVGRGAGDRREGGVPRVVRAGRGGRPGHRPAGPRRRDRLPGVGQDRLHAQQPGFVVRGIHAGGGVRRVGGQGLRRGHRAHRSGGGAAHLDPVHEGGLSRRRAAGHDGPAGDRHRRHRPGHRLSRHFGLPGTVHGGVPGGDGPQGDVPASPRPSAGRVGQERVARHRRLLPKSLQIVV